MRHLLAAVACFAVFLIVAACGGSSSSSSTPTVAPSVTASPTPSPSPRVPGSLCTGASLVRCVRFVAGHGRDDLLPARRDEHRRAGLHPREPAGAALQGRVRRRSRYHCAAERIARPAVPMIRRAASTKTPSICRPARRRPACAPPGQLTVTIAVADIGRWRPALRRRCRRTSSACASPARPKTCASSCRTTSRCRRAPRRCGCTATGRRSSWRNRSDAAALIRRATVHRHHTGHSCPGVFVRLARTTRRFGNADGLADTDAAS